jgi:hypothetical protein
MILELKVYDQRTKSVILCISNSDVLKPPLGIEMEN